MTDSSEPRDHLNVYFDGGCQPKNPGGVASCGWFITNQKGNKIAEGSGVVADGGPKATNNYAEYCALGMAIRHLIDEEWSGKSLTIRGDSRLIVEQVAGNWKCKAEHLKPCLERIQEYLDRLDIEESGMKTLQILLSSVAAILMVTVASAQDKRSSTQQFEISPQLIDAWLQVQKPRKRPDTDRQRNPDKPRKPIQARQPRPKTLTQPVYRVPNLVPITVEKKDGVIDQLKVAVVTYTKGDVTLDVIGTVHVADPGYYRMLNERFKQYDALCYELVADKDKKPQKGQEGLMRNIVQVFLELDQQLAIVDYNAENFIHADLTPNALAEVMKKRGDNLVTITLSTVADLMRKHNKAQGNPSDAQTLQQAQLQILGNPNAAVEIKRMMAQQFITSGDVSEQFGGVLKAYLIDERNIAALRVVEAVAEVKKKIGLFYGAAHLPDFDKRLQDQNWKRTKISYDVAWDKLSKNQEELEYLFKLMKGLEEKKK
ncbi:rnhA [Symbiodinium microadriaticum]|nr:rnhA [Symbiodinium microadriaticum]